MSVATRPLEQFLDELIEAADLAAERGDMAVWLMLLSRIEKTEDKLGAFKE